MKVHAKNHKMIYETNRILHTDKLKKLFLFHL